MRQITHRSHDVDCPGKTVKGAHYSRTARCTSACRAGEPWPTLRLLPGDEARTRAIIEERRKDPRLQVSDAYS